MEKNTRTKNLLLVVLLVAVLTLSISYAFLAQQLDITNTAVTVSPGGWNVKFTNASCVTSGYIDAQNGFTAFNGGATIDHSNPTAILANMAVTFKAPGDKVVCQIRVENLGDIDATIQSFDLGASTISYTSRSRSDAGFDENDPDDVAAAEADEDLLDDAISYTLVYKAGDDHEGEEPGTGVTLVGQETYDEANLIEAGSYRDFVLTIEYVEDPLNEQHLPSNDVLITGFHTIFNYKQV